MIKSKIDRFVFTRKKGEKIQEFIIKKKDFGETVLYDIFYGSLFLLTLGAEHNEWLGNWQTARSEPVGLDQELLNEINAFITNIKT